MLLKKFEQFLESVDLMGYREKYRPIKIVEMDLPKEIQAINMLYNVYWEKKKFLNFEKFYDEYLQEHKTEIDNFQGKTGMCKICFGKGLPARIYRTWASIITQIHAGYVAESVFGDGTVEMSSELDHKGADFQVKYRGKILNYQVKKKSLGREVRQEKPRSKNSLLGKFVDIKYEVPSSGYFENPKKKNGEYKLPYKRFKENKELKRFPNGFVVFTPYAFEQKKKEIDETLK
ncbi:MAG: TaqI family restriction endonuclease [Parcubacteria group bacterium]|nr:TaqI family restriction endonuclease [Parcubacteria group bacterium]